jgi:heptosyltransferase-2
MENILIIKTGAAGDLVRTTSLLGVLKGNIYWVTADRYKPLLPPDKNIVKVHSVDESFQALKGIKFDHVISLEEDIECARLAVAMDSIELTGIYLSGNGIDYTDSSARWFDMSRISRFGLVKANQLKADNRDSYQSLIFQMLGRKFKGEPYQIFKDDSIMARPALVGIEKRTGRQWPNKQWWGYDELTRKLTSNGVATKSLKQRTDIRDYLADIAECSHVVSGDTLAMHVALAYKKNCVAVFNCTSPQEIYDYGLLKKIVSPSLNKYFYSTSEDAAAIGSVSLADVYRGLHL